MSDNSDDIGRQLRRFKQGLKVRAPGSETKSPIWQTALLGWQDGFRALGQMPKMAIKAFVVVFICMLMQFPFVAKGINQRPPAIELLSFVLSILRIFLLAPVAIAVHRYVLLGEITETYFPDPASARFRHFFLFGVLLEAICLPANLFDGLPSFLLFCLAVFCCTRLVVLFPAIAIDGSGSNFAGAWQNSSGHFWRIFATAVLTMLPGLLIVVFFALLPQSVQSVAAVLTPFAVVIAIFVGPALASHLYRGLAQQVDQPAQP